MLSLEKDIASLIYAYNLVNAFSSFSQVAISFNDNLINLFEYEIYKINSLFEESNIKIGNNIVDNNKYDLSIKIFEGLDAIEKSIRI